MSSFWCRWFGIGCPPVPVPIPIPPPVPQFKAIAVVVTSSTAPIPGALVILDGNPNPFPLTNLDGYTLQNNVPMSLSASQLFVVMKGFKDYSVHVDLPTTNYTLSATLTPIIPSLPAPPSRDEMIGVNISFQGLVVETAQFGKLPWFEAALPWLTPEDRKAAYKAKHNAGDTHCLVHLPCGPALYDEPGQPYSADRFGPLDWTSGNTKIDSKFTDLLREVIREGFNVLLYLGGDADHTIADKQVDLLHDNEDFRTTLYKYCAIMPGWDGVFSLFLAVFLTVSWLFV